jgi:hypothetical protein
MMKKKSKGYAKGGMMKAKGMKAGGKMPMVKKDGKMVPAFAADGKGKMMGGGKVKMSPKGMSAGGAVTAVSKDMKKKGGAKGGKTVARGSGAARPQMFGKNG